METEARSDMGDVSVAKRTAYLEGSVAKRTPSGERRQPDPRQVDSVPTLVENGRGLADLKFDCSCFASDVCLSFGPCGHGFVAVSLAEDSSASFPCCFLAV